MRPEVGRHYLRFCAGKPSLPSWPSSPRASRRRSSRPSSWCSSSGPFPCSWHSSCWGGGNISSHPAGLDPAPFLGRPPRGQPPRGGWGPAIPDALRGLAIVARLCIHDVVDVALRIAVIEGEQTRLDLHHDAVTRQEHVVHVRQRPVVVLHPARLER